MRVSVEAVGVLAPGLPDWETAKDILTSRRAFVPAPLIGPGPIGLLAAVPRLVLPANSLATLEPPPKSPLLAA